MNVWLIAWNTFREAVRDKVLYLLLAFAVLLILASRAVGWVSYFGDKKIMTDLGLGAVWLSSALLAIFIGTQMIYKEIDKRTLYTILSKPIRRWEFVLGKYGGLLLTTTVNLAVLSAVFLVYLKFMDAPVTLGLAQALLLTFIEMVMLTALALFFSTVSSPVLSAIFTFMLFCIGQLTKWLVDLGAVVKQMPPWGDALLRGVYLLMPNLHNFNIRQEAVEAAGRGQGLAIPWEDMRSCVLYGLSYTAAVLLVSVLFFRRRDL